MKALKFFLGFVLAGVIGGMIVLFFAPKPEALPPTVVKEQTALRPQSAVLDHTTMATAVVPEFNTAAELSMKSVVHIKSVESEESAYRRYEQQRQRDPFSFFFGQDMFFGPSQPQQRSGTGSGVIYSKDGYILTNNHVIDFADKFLVTLYDNSTYDAVLIGRDADTDLAVLKVKGQNFESIELGDSESAKVGDWVLAVGNPFDLTSTVTAGIISAKGRHIGIVEKGGGIESFIQTDAAVNPGNSGGALVDVNGRLIGINTAIATPTGTFAGYSFAIPVDMAIPIIEDLIKYGSFQRGSLGVNVINIDKDLQSQLNLTVDAGVLLEVIKENSAAEAAGLQRGDIVTEANGHETRDAQDLRSVLAKLKVGDELNLVIVRDDKLIKKRVVLK